MAGRLNQENKTSRSEEDLERLSIEGALEVVKRVARERNVLLTPEVEQYMQQIYVKRLSDTLALACENAKERNSVSINLTDVQAAVRRLDVKRTVKKD